MITFCFAEDAAVISASSEQPLSWTSFVFPSHRYVRMQDAFLCVLFDQFEVFPTMLWDC